MEPSKSKPETKSNALDHSVVMVVMNSHDHFLQEHKGIFFSLCFYSACIEAGRKAWRRANRWIRKEVDEQAREQAGILTE